MSKGPTRISIEVSEKNESTSEPWWVLIDPSNIKEIMNGVAKYGEVPSSEYILSAIAFSIEGPFFSREEGEEYLKRRSYAHSSNATIWCASGYRTTQYKAALREAR